MVKILFLVLFLATMFFVGIGIFHFMNRLTKKMMKQNGPEDYIHLHHFDE